MIGQLESPALSIPALAFSNWWDDPIVPPPPPDIHPAKGTVYFAGTDRRVFQAQNDRRVFSA